MFLYIVIVLILLYAFYHEVKDYRYTDKINGNGKDGERRHKLIADYIALPQDSREIVIGKTLSLCGSFSKRVIWRSALFFSLAIVLLLFLVFDNTCSPIETKIFVGFFLAGGIIYFMWNFYTFHFYDTVSGVLSENLSYLKWPIDRRTYVCTYVQL